MTAKQYLEKVHYLRKRCDSIDRRLRFLRARAEGMRGISYDADRVQTSPGNSLEAAVVDMVQIETEYRDLIAEYAAAVATRSKQITAMADARYAEILWLRYIETTDRGRQMTLDDIAEEMGYSKSHIARLHGAALQAFAKAYGKDDNF